MHRIVSSYAFVTALFLGAYAVPCSAAPIKVLAEDFESTLFDDLGPFPVGGASLEAGGGSPVDAESFPGFAAKYFRNAGYGLTTLGVTGLGEHTDLRLSFDLAFIDTWDGFDGAACCTPDWLYLTVDGVPFLQLTSDLTTGSSPIYGPGVVVAAGAFGADGATDAIVHYSDLVVPHTTSAFTLGIQAGGGGYEAGDNESWGIDNLQIFATPANGGGGGNGGGAVPEPVTWAIMILGFAMVGANIRRRTSRPAL